MNIHLMSAFFIFIFGTSCRTRLFQDQKTRISTIARDGNVYETRLLNGRLVVRNPKEVKVLTGVSASEKLISQKLAQNLVRSQFEYSRGYFSLKTGTPFYENEPTVSSIRAINTKEVEITYDLNFSLVMDPDLAKEFNGKEIYLPKYADNEGLVSFYTKYSAGDCGTDLSNSDSDIEAAQRYFYFFVPREACIIWKEGVSKNAGLVSVKIEIDTKSSGQAKSTKSPEYERIWSDGLFKALVFVSNIGPSEEPVNSDLPPPDAGVSAANMFYRRMKLKYPDAKVTIKGSNPNIKGKEAFAPANQEARFEWSEGDRKFDIVLLFPKSYGVPTEIDDPDFVKSFRKHSENADLISFSGHANFGDSLKVFGDYAEIKPDHWRLFYVNSCWSVGYLLEGLLDKEKKQLMSRVEEKNPGVPWSRDLDLVVNGSSSNMFKAPANMMALIIHLIEGKKTYVEILNSLTSEAAPIVLGETDNGK